MLGEFPPMGDIRHPQGTTQALVRCKMTGARLLFGFGGPQIGDLPSMALFWIR
jgi:hypothetical protein